MSHTDQITAAEHVSNGHLRWSMSTRLQNSCLEEDGSGIAPAEVRRLLIAQHGLWEVRVLDADARTTVMHSLRQVFDVSLDDARSRTAALPGAVYSGTKGEATLFAESLRAQGVEAVLTKV